MVISIVASGCGRIGYDEIDALGGRPNEGPSHGASGAPGVDAASADATNAGMSGGTSGSGGGSGSGGAPSNGGTVGQAGAGGGTPGNGGAPGSGGVVVSDAAAGGTPSAGGTVGSDAAAGGGSGGTLGTGGVIGSGGASGSGGVVGGDAGIVGCADGQREGFLNVTTYPNIAACDGGFQVPGVVSLTGPACGRAAGDDGARPDGSGCNAEDLCAAGFHVCTSAVEVGAKSSTGCTGAVAGTASVFYLSRQSGGGQQKCGPGTNDVFGCGNIGFRPSSGCGVLDRASGDLCSALGAPWSCGSDLTAEALHVTKASPAVGGVLCCRD